MSPPLDKVQQRYLNDVRYRTLVDVLQVQIESLELSPSEIREAAMYAVYLVEARRPIRIYPGEWPPPRVTGDRYDFPKPPPLPVPGGPKGDKR